MWLWPEILLGAVGNIDEVKRNRQRLGLQCHKGFDYREAVAAFGEVFEDTRMVGSPFPPLKGALNVGVVLSGTKPL